MTSYLSILHATIRERSQSDAEARAHRFAAAATGSVILAGLVDAYDAGGFGALVEQLDRDIVATKDGLAEFGKAVDLPLFGPKMMGAKQ